MKADNAATSDERIAQLEDALLNLINNMGGHSHWREGGAGGTCSTCVQQSEAISQAREVLNRG